MVKTFVFFRIVRYFSKPPLEGERSGAANDCEKDCACERGGDWNDDVEKEVVGKEAVTVVGDFTTEIDDFRLE